MLLQRQPISFTAMYFYNFMCSFHCISSSICFYSDLNYSKQEASMTVFRVHVTEFLRWQHDFWGDLRGGHICAPSLPGISGSCQLRQQSDAHFARNRTRCTDTPGPSGFKKPISNKKERRADTVHSTDEPYAQWKKPVAEGHILWDSMYVKWPEQAHLPRYK